MASVLVLALAALAVTAAPRLSVADESWVIRSFDAHYKIDRGGSITATEGTLVDFGSLQRHGIFRDIPMRYAYDSERDRLVAISVVSVDDGATAIPFETSHVGANLRIKIGDPDRLVTGQQRYRVTYTVSGAINPFADHDEFYWNVTGHQWPVSIERSTATVDLPGPGLQKVTCFGGSVGSSAPCTSTSGESTANFKSTVALQPGSDLTVVVSLQKGLVQVSPPQLVARDSNGLGNKLADFFSITPMTIALSSVAAFIAFGLLLRQWWITGRDRWFGDKYYFTDSPREEQIKPLFSHETIVVEYQPPEIPAERRRLRPAEVGLLLDERADTLDVSATVVDLAVRGYLRIEELPKEGWLSSKDYEITKLKKADKELLSYESAIMRAIFGDGWKVRLSELDSNFSLELQNAKEELYTQAVSVNKFFPRDPESVRSYYRMLAAILVAAAVLVLALLGIVFGAAIVALPVVATGLAVFFLGGTMPRRTGFGREMYRRCLGFRLYMMTAEKRRQDFAEKAAIFDEYLPYAIVFGCAKRWAKSFEEVGVKRPVTGWYVSPDSVTPWAFAIGIRGFSASISAAAATPPSTPGAAGFSGFSGGGFGGGGFAGGGVGGGGGGSW